MTERTIYLAGQRAPVTMTEREFNDTAASFADELCREVERLQAANEFSPEAVARSCRKNRAGMRVLMEEGR